MSDTKIAIITGAGRGIGRATAVVLGQSEYTCVAVSRSPGEIDETARLAGNRSIAIAGDVSKLSDIQRIVQTTLDRFGRVDALVNNAGVAPLLPFEQMTDAIWDDVIATNLTSVYRFSRAVWPTMVGQKSGVIVSVSSEASRDPFPGFAAYAAAKAGVSGFTRALAKEGNAHGIRVLAVAPAGVETAMLRKIVTADQLPADQLLAPENVANAIRACICGDLTHASGETIFVHRNA